MQRLLSHIVESGSGFVMRVIVASIAALFVIVSGCSSSPKAQEQASSGPASTVSFEGGEGGGSIQGSVMDDEERPIEGASVAILELKLLATSDATGGFAFLGVPPGDHVVAALRLGYEESRVMVTVAPDQESTVTIKLQPIVAPVPWSYTETKDGLLERGIEVWSRSYNTGFAISDGDVEYVWETKEPTQVLGGLVVELHWRGTQALAKSLHLFVDTRSAEDDSDFGVNVFDFEGPSPIVGRLEGEALQKALNVTDSYCPPTQTCRMGWRVFTGTGATGQDLADVGLTFDQHFTGYATHFFRSTPPAEFTAAPVS